MRAPNGDSGLAVDCTRARMAWKLPYNRAKGLSHQPCLRPGGPERTWDCGGRLTFGLGEWPD